MNLKEAKEILNESGYLLENSKPITVDYINQKKLYILYW